MIKLYAIFSFSLCDDEKKDEIFACSCRWNLWMSSTQRNVFINHKENYTIRENRQQEQHPPQGWFHLFFYLSCRKKNIIYVLLSLFSLRVKWKNPKEKKEKNFYNNRQPTNEILADLSYFFAIE